MSRQRLRTFWTVVLCFSLTACADGTESRTIAVSVQASSLGTSVQFDEEGPIVVCDLLMRAQAVGSDRMTATWEDGHIEILGGPNRNISAGYIPLTGEELGEIWSKQAIAAEEDIQAQLRVGHWEPFSGRGSFRYLPQGATANETARFSFSCDTDALDTSGEAWLRFTELVGVHITIDSGDSLTVRYQAGGDEGIVLTEIQVANGTSTVVTRVDERNYSDDKPRLSSYRMVRIPVTPEYPIGSQLRVRVVTTATSGVQAVSNWMEGPVVVDRSPPVISTHCLVGGIASECVSPPAVFTYTAADTMILRVSGVDNYALGYFVWRIGALSADSIPIDRRPRITHEVRIPVQSSWLNVQSVTIYLRDAVGNVSAPVEYPIRLIPQVEARTRTLLLSGVFTPVSDIGGKNLYLSSTSGAVAAISLETMSEQWRLQLAGLPVGIDLAPGERSLAVALQDSKAVAILDVAGRLIRTVPLGGDFTPRGVVYAADGSIVVTGAAALMRRVSPDGELLSPPVLQHSYMPPLRPFRASDYSRIYVRDSSTCTFVLNRMEDPMTECLYLRFLPGYTATFSTDGERVAVGPYLLNRDFRGSREITVPGLEAPITAISPDGRKFYWTYRKGLLVLDSESGSPERVIAHAMPTQLLLQAGNDRLLAFAWGDINGQGHTRISVIELE